MKLFNTGLWIEQCGVHEMFAYLYKIFILFILVDFSVKSQSPARKFIEALIYNNENVSEYINKDEIRKSRRLGIKYKDVKHKELITYEIPPEINSAIISGRCNYEIEEIQLDNGYSEIIFNVPEKTTKKTITLKTVSFILQLT